MKAIAPAAPATVGTPSDPSGARLVAAHYIFSALVHVRFMMLDAAIHADNAELAGFAKRIGERVRSLNDELLPDINAAIRQLEKEAGK
jgi:hypothetical protein